MKTTDQEDNVNLRILHCLSKHGRMPYAKIADTLRLSPNAVRDRILSMERRGVIRAYRAVADESLLGRPCHVLALLHAGPTHTDALQAAQSHPGIVRIHECTGRYALMVEAVGESAEAVDSLLSSLLYQHGYEPAEYIILGAPMGTARAAATSEEPSMPLEVSA